MKHMNQITRYAGGLYAQLREKARASWVYVTSAGAGGAFALAVVPHSLNSGWSLFSFSMADAVDAMMTMAETLFNGLVPAFGNIWGIALGFGLLTLISGAIFAVVRGKKG